MNRYDTDVETQPKTAQTDAKVADREAVPVASLEAIAAGTVKTERLSASRAQDVARAAAILRAGGIVAFPTETVYGLGANALDAAAVEKIFLAKQRPHWDPLIVHISDREMLDQVAAMTLLHLDQLQNHVILSAAKNLRISPLPLPVFVPSPLSALLDAFWPGPLTLLLPRTQAIPDAVTAGRPLVGVRMPAHPVAQELIRQAGVPIAAPSANRFGHTSPTTAAHVLDDLDGRIDAVLDGGPARVGVESTVLDPTQWPMVIYRQGAVTQHMIQVKFGRESVIVFTPPLTETEPESLPSPGVGLRHYAPNARVVLVPVNPDIFDPRDSLVATIREQSSSENTGVLLPNGWNQDRAAHTFTWGYWDKPEVLARNLFAGLRALDDLSATVIVAPIPNGPGIAAALRDRLEKAAISKSAVRTALEFRRI